MNNKSLLSILMLGALFGCASPSYNYVPKSVQISFPEIGVISTAQVGDTLVSQGSSTEHDALQVDSTTSLGFLSYSITNGIFLKVGEDAESSYFSINNRFDGGGELQRSALADPAKAVLAYKNQNKICGVSIFNGTACSSEVPYKLIKYKVTSANNFQQSLIYSGKVGVRVKLSYREFSGNLARPAYNNEVDYDLSESKIIGYKGARIEILEATNEYIKYKLISNFNVNK